MPHGRVSRYLRSLLAAMIASGALLPVAAWAQQPVSGMTTFAGVRTFVGAPYVPRCEHLEADIAVLGVPFDEGTWGWPGERYGPRDIREGSQDYKQYDLKDGFYYLDRDQFILKGKRWADCGDSVARRCCATSASTSGWSARSNTRWAK